MAALPILNAFLDDGGEDIVVVEQQPDGTSKQRRVRAQYTSYHLASDIDVSLMRSLKKAPQVQHIVHESERWVRIGWATDVFRKQARYKFKDIGVETYEGDVDPVMYFLVSTKAKIAKPRRCSLDFEADSRVSLSRKEDMRTLSWSVTDFTTEETFDDVLEEDTDDAEARLYENLVKRLRNYDQILVWQGDWEGGEFDTVLFDARSRRCGVGVDARDWMWLNQLAVWKRMNAHSASSGAEKESFKLEDIAHEQLGEGKEKAPQFVIDRFGERAKRGLGAMTWDLWEAGGEYRELLRRYNRRDAELLVKLEKRKQFLTLFQAVCEVCGIPPVDRSLQPTRQMDGFILRLGREHDHRFPSKTFREEQEDKGQFKGAVVFNPKSVPDDDKGWSKEDARAWREKHGLQNGILRDVHVCDFASLYPSVMRTYNLDGTTIVGRRSSREVERMGVEAHTIWSPGTGIVTTSERKGYLPLTFETLVAMRGQFSDLAASLPAGSPQWADAMAISTAYKVTANSFYGGGATPFSRFNNRDASESCTQNGVHFLKITAHESEKRGMVLAYGDTDSVFVMKPSEQAYRAFVNWLNTKRFPAEVKSHGCVENHIKLAFEKTFERIVFLSSKAYVGRYSQYKGTPATRECHGLNRVFKKNIGFVWVAPDDPDPKNPKVIVEGDTCRECGGIGALVDEPEIKGVAYKRGDRGKLARELQGKIIDLLVGGVKVRNDAGKKVPIFSTGYFAVDAKMRGPTEDIDVFRRVIEAARNHVMAEELSIEEVRLSAGLKGSLKSYASTETGAHVRVARMLAERGIPVGEGMRIEYVVVDGSKSPQIVIPADDYAGDCDRFYLWERVYRPTKSMMIAAFPDLEDEWEQLENVRPKKPRGRAAKVPDEQLGFMLAKPKPPRADVDELAVPMFSAEPLIVRVPESAGEAAIDRLHEVFKAHPGARSVQIVLALNSGAEATLALPHDIRVSTGPKLRDAVQRAIAGESATAP